jgi:hypothetical protein
MDPGFVEDGVAAAASAIEAARRQALFQATHGSHWVPAPFLVPNDRGKVRK